MGMGAAISKPNEQLKQMRRFFENQLKPLDLTEAQIKKQTLNELEQSLERVNDALKFPAAFGTLKLKTTVDGLFIVSSGIDFHYEFGIMPILLERKKLIIERINLLKKPPKGKKSNTVVNPTQKGKLKSSHKSSKAKTSSPSIKILFLASNPKDTPQLRLDEEMREIDRALLQAEFRDKFEIMQHWAVRIYDIQGYLLRHKPDIIHFSGHGSIQSEIIMEDNMGSSRPVSPRALSQLFAALKDNIKCVVLNACYSELQAQAIAEHIDCVVGMSRSISDPAAIGFASSFYQALGYGKDLKTAFDLGCNQIDLENLNEQNTPKLLALKSNPTELIFAQE